MAEVQVEVEVKVGVHFFLSVGYLESHLRSHK